MRFLCSACRTILTGEPGQEVECRLCKTMCKAPESAMAPGAVIGDFAIVRELARGGMGIVYLARQISLDRLVALKILQEKYAADSQFVEDFIREARAAARISHPNIVQAYAVGEENGIYYFAMELIDGDTMKGVLKKEQKIAPRKAAEIIRSIADALDFAWTEQKIVHQDIKPDNIMLTRRGQAKLADLGLSRMATGSLDLNADDDEVMGTPQYISPEQLTGMPTDIRSDIYSLGATFYHLVTGEFPYQGKDGNEIARQHVEGTLIPPIEKQPDLPPELNRIIVKMMAKTLEERYQTGAELVDDLKNFLQGTPAAATGKEEKPAPARNVKQTPPLNKTAAPALNAAPAPKLNTAAAPALNAAPAPKLNTAAAPALNAAPAPKLNTAAAPALNAAPAPKVNAPAVPKVNAPAAPKVNAPAVPKVNAPAAPKVNAPAAPKVNAPAVPKVNAPAVPKVNAPAVPKVNAPADPKTEPAKQEAKPDAKAGGLKLQKKEEANSESGAPPIVQQLQEDQKKKKKLTIPKWVTMTCAGVVGVVALTVIVLAILIYFRKMPAFLLPVEKQIFTMMNLSEQDGKLVRGTPATPASQVAAAQPKKAAAPQPPPPPPKPKTRPDFVQNIQALRQLAAQGDVEKFLAGTDEFMLKYPTNQTPEEKTMRLALLQDYGPNDEILRINEYRNQARAKREAAILKAAEAAEKQAEAERKRKEEAERIAAEQKVNMEKAVRDAAADKAAELAKIQPRIDAYVNQKNNERKALAGAFFTELGNPASTRWKECYTAAITAGTLPPDVQPAEKSAAQQTAAFARSLLSDFLLAGSLKKAIADPAILNAIQLEVSQQLTRLERFEKPHRAIVCNKLTDKVFQLDLRRKRSRNAVLSRMLGNKQIAAIYTQIPAARRMAMLSEHLDLLLEDYEHLLKTAAPARKQFFSRLLEEYFADRMQNGSAEEKAALEKAHSLLPEFRKAAGK